mmetsp:Transcript_33078/g.106123  ORF Transcript_33078/g.106123 Transcript_33078/m.106123 type:complete len:285 (+) Transcript_33078:613-1467(+)
MRDVRYVEHVLPQKLLEGHASVRTQQRRPQLRALRHHEAGVHVRVQPRPAVGARRVVGRVGDGLPQPWHGQRCGDKAIRGAVLGQPPGYHHLFALAAQPPVQRAQLRVLQLCVVVDVQRDDRAPAPHAVAVLEQRSQPHRREQPRRHARPRHEGVLAEADAAARRLVQGQEQALVRRRRRVEVQLELAPAERRNLAAHKSDCGARVVAELGRPLQLEERDGKEGGEVAAHQPTQRARAAQSAAAERLCCGHASPPNRVRHRARARPCVGGGQRGAVRARRRRSR